MEDNAGAIGTPQPQVKVNSPLAPRTPPHTLRIHPLLKATPPPSLLDSLETEQSKGPPLWQCMAVHCGTRKLQHSKMTPLATKTLMRLGWMCAFAKVNNLLPTPGIRPVGLNRDNQQQWCTHTHTHTHTHLLEATLDAQQRNRVHQSNYQTARRPAYWQVSSASFCLYIMDKWAKTKF